jgi:hypothetical protein
MCKLKFAYNFETLGLLSKNITSELAETYNDGTATILFQHPIYHC